MYPYRILQLRVFNGLPLNLILSAVILHNKGNPAKKWTKENELRVTEKQQSTTETLRI